MSEIKVNDNNEIILWNGKKSKGTSILDALLNKGLFLAIFILFIDCMIFAVILLQVGPRSAADYFWENIWVHYVPLIVYLLTVIYSLVRSYTTTYAVTNKYVYIQSVLPRKKVISNDIDDIEYVSVRRDIFDRIAHTGDITVFTRDEVEKNGILVPEEKHLEFQNIKNYKEVFGIIEKIRTRTGSLTDPDFINGLKM